MRRSAAALCFSTLLAVPAQAVESIEHRVESGESLWSIAAQEDVYADPYLWPVIYKFNRDQIKDPGRIYPDQVLQIPIHVDDATRRQAHGESGAPSSR
jgi:nucleoid-associated protein YgaU